MTTYFTLLTPTGLAKIANAQLTQNTVAINRVAVGDSNGVNYTPTGNETSLKKERWRGGVASVNIDVTNPNWIVVEAVIPSSVGGFTLREVALYDVDGDMIAIGNYPDTYKPLASDGSTMDLVLRTIIEVSNAESITLRIDPNVIVASRKYVDDKVSPISSGITSLQTQVTEHLGQDVFSENGAHGIRYFNNELSAKDDQNQWITIETGNQLTDGTYTKIAPNDLNQMIESGFYTANFVSAEVSKNFPANTGKWMIEVFTEESSKRTIQIAHFMDVNDGYLMSYARWMNLNSVWTAWSRTIPNASTSSPGIVQLSDSINAPVSSYAATANAVKQLNDLKANKQQEALLTPTGKNNWNVASSRYFKDEFGIVHLYFNASSGNIAANTVVMTLPVGYRPNFYVNFAVNTSNSASTVFKACLVWVTPTGDVALMAPGDTLVQGYISFPAL